MIYLDVRDLNEAWWKSLREVLLRGREYVIDTGSFEQSKRKELDFIVLQIRKPNTRPLVPDVPLGVPAPTSMEYVENYLQYLQGEYRYSN